MGRRARVAAGKTVEDAFAHPAEGRTASFKANTSTSNGASQYSGMAMKDWVTVVITLSVLRPCLSAAITPRGKETRAAVTRASMTRLSVVARAGITWSATGVRLTWESPMSPVKKLTNHRRDWTGSGSWSPKLVLRDSTVESSMTSPATRDRMILRTGSPGVTKGMRKNEKDDRRRATTKVAVLRTMKGIIRTGSC